jgi:hypothetical protein
MNPSRWFGDKYYMTVKAPDGTTKDISFSSKEKMAEYLKKPVTAAPKKADTSSKAILD